MDILISDTHLANHKPFSRILENGVNSRLQLQLDIIEQSLKVGNELGCERWIHLGDLFNDENVDSDVYNLFKQLLAEYEGEFDEFIILSGNHDKTALNEYKNSALVLDRFLNKVRIITHPEEHTCLGCATEWFIPYHSEKRDEDISILEAQFKERDLKNTIIYMHQTIKGSVGQNNKIIEKGINPSAIRWSLATFCGHTHSPKSFYNRIHILGAPYHLDFGDSGERFFYVVDRSKIIDKVTTAHPKFITVYDEKKIKKDNNFYRLITDKKTEVEGSVKVVKLIERKNIQRAVSYKPEELIKQYCTQDEELTKLGIKLFNEANK